MSEIGVSTENRPEVEVLKIGVEHFRPPPQIKPEPEIINKIKDLKKSRAFNFTTVLGLGAITIHEIANGIPTNATIPAIMGGMELKRLITPSNN